VRVVSLCPSLTDTVFALGRGDWLVGRSKFCVQPRGVVERVERVGGTKNPKLDRIVALAPDLVLLNEEENRREDAEALAAAGVPTSVTFPRDVDGAIASVRALGEALDARDAAAGVVADIEAARARARAVAARVGPWRFAYLIWREPWMAAGGDTYISALLGEAGGVNVYAASAARYPELTLAELAAAAPARVLLSSEPFPFAARHVPDVEAAVPGASVALVDGEALSWHGARTAAGLGAAAAVAPGSSG
jgi:ABC-type Fe3+-hydroxamate transport system substrate-binding protein